MTCQVKADFPTSCSARDTAHGAPMHRPRRPHRGHAAPRVHLATAMPYLFAVYDGAPYHPQLLSDAFNKLADPLRNPPQTLLRPQHTHATLLLKAGVPIKVVSERLGHSTAGFTMAHELPSTCLPGT